MAKKKAKDWLREAGSEEASRSLSVLKKLEKALNHKGSWPFLLRKNLWKLRDRYSGRLISGYQQFPAFSMQRWSYFQHVKRSSCQKRPCLFCIFLTIIFSLQDYLRVKTRESVIFQTVWICYVTWKLLDSKSCDMQTIYAIMSANFWVMTMAR